MIGIKTDISAHWYDVEGNPKHDATLREARKEDLFPSVTTVGKIKQKFVLDQWKTEQTILAGLKNPKRDDEDLRAYCQRIYDESLREGKEAARTGSLVHNSIEATIKGEPFILSEEDSVLNEKVIHTQNWVTENLIKCVSEQTYVSLLYGYAGKIDCVGEIKGYENLSLIDFKTQKPKKEKFNFYDDWILQLAAYYMLLEEASIKIDNIISVVISSDLALNKIEVFKWELEDLRYGQKMFMSCLAFWCECNKYNLKRVPNIINNYRSFY